MTPTDPLASILIVDDRAANLMALEALLAPLGERIVRASSGEQALRLAAAEDFALILMDVHMPDLDGFETVARLRRFRESVPVIFITAVHDERDHAARGYALGAVDYLAKPIEPQFLLAKVNWFVSLWQRGVLIERQKETIREREREAARAQVMRETAEAATRAKDELLAMVSHDLLTPLTAIIGWAELLQKGLVEPDRVDKAIDTIFHCALLQRDLVEDLLDVSRIVAGKLEIRPGDLELAGVVERLVEVATPAAREHGVELRLSGVASLPVRGDDHRLQQLLGNLVQNAIKFSKRGGCVAISLEREHGRAVVRVRDWGAGISPQLLPHVFERFHQGEAARRHGGLGLGLAIARHIAELHGGTLEAASAGEGQGATFTLRLPVVVEQALTA